MTDTPETRVSSLSEPEPSAALTGGWPIQVRNLLARHLELVFISLIFLVVLAVFFFFPYKMAFLNFLYLPVLTAAYFMGKRKALLGATFCILLVIFFVLLHPEWFTVRGGQTDTLLQVGIWGAFLILVSASVGSLQERLAKGF